MEKTLTFYKNNSTGQWYLYIKWFPNFLRSLLLMVCGADRLLDILFLKTYQINSKKEILSYYQNKESCNILSITVNTENKIENCVAKLRLNDNINKEFEFNRISNGRFYMVSKINLFLGVSFLNNYYNKYFDNLNLGNNIWISYVTLFVFKFTYPKNIYISISDQAISYRKTKHILKLIKK